MTWLERQRGPNDLGKMVKRHKFLEIFPKSPLSQAKEALSLVRLAISLIEEGRAVGEVDIFRRKLGEDKLLKFGLYRVDTSNEREIAGLKGVSARLRVTVNTGGEYLRGLEDYLDRLAPVERIPYEVSKT